MLILSRKKGEKIIIGDGEIEILITEISPGQVRIGVTAPKDISVHRSEIFDLAKRNGSFESGHITLESLACG